MAEAHEVHILVADAAQQTVDILGLEEALQWLLVVALALAHALPHRHNATDVLIIILVGLARTAAIVSPLATTGNQLTGGQHGLPAILTLGSLDALGGLLIEQQLAALDTTAAQNVEDLLVELNIVDGTSQLVMTEMSRALVIIQTTRAAQLTIL